VFFDVFANEELEMIRDDQVVQEAAREPGEHEEDNTDVLSVRQARTLLCRLSREDEEQERLQAPVEQGRQVPIKVQSQAQEQAQGQVTVEEEGRSCQKGLSDGRSERRRL
jgi:hypothetical protein